MKLYLIFLINIIYFVFSYSFTNHNVLIKFNDLDSISIKNSFLPKNAFKIIQPNASSKDRSYLNINIGNVRTDIGAEIFSIDLSKDNVIFDSLTTLSWNWMIKDTRLSDGIAIKLIFEQNGYYQIFSHSRYTFSDVVFCNERSSVWKSHKINLTKAFINEFRRNRLYGRKIVKISLISMEAINQEISISYIELSEESAKKSDKVINYQIVDNDYTKTNPKTESVALSDIDCDGDLDIYCVNQLSQNFARFNDGKGRFSEAKFLYSNSQSFRNNHAIFVDVNNDGWIDLFEGRETISNKIFINNGNREFLPFNHFQETDFITNTYSSLWADLNDDFKLDFIDIFPNSINNSSSGCNFFLSKKNSYNLKYFPDTMAFFAGAMADLNNDKKLELFLANNKKHNYLIELLENNTSEKKINYRDYFPLKLFHKTLDEDERTEGGVFADFDNDGDFDLYLANDGSPNKLFLFENGTFYESAKKCGLNDSLKSEGFLIADFDNDMDWDVYILHTFSRNKLLLNDGNGFFYDGTEGSGLEDPGGAMGAACGDIDNDGDIDICIADPYSGVRYLNNICNKSSFLKIKIRGQPGNFEGIRTKIFIYNENDDRLVFYHQTTKGDGFQFEAFPAQFHIGLIPDNSYRMKTVFTDGKEKFLSGIKAASSVTILYPQDNLFLDFKNFIAYKFKEPFFYFLRQKSIYFSIFLIILFGLFISLFKEVIRIKRLYKIIIFSFIAISIFYFFYSLKSISSPLLLGTIFFSIFYNEIIINPTRSFLRKHYGKESGWDKLYDHLKAFHHGGVAVNNIDRLIFLFQNQRYFVKDKVSYLGRVTDASNTFLYQTSDQLKQLIYILKDLHWDRILISKLQKAQKRVIKFLKKENLVEKKLDDHFAKHIKYLKQIIHHTEEVYNHILPYFSCFPVQIVNQVSKEKYQDYDIKIQSGVNDDTSALIKGYELGNIISDLLENGIRSVYYSYEGTIFLHDDDSRIFIDVSDNGRGILSKNTQKIFEKGFSTHEKGTGFGLFYARDTLVKYNGQIKILKTNSENGTTMRVSLKKIKHGNFKDGSKKNTFN